VYRDRYTRFYNLIGEGTLTYTERKINMTHNMRYYPLEGERAGYVGMAEQYRSYVLETKDLRRLETNGGDIPFELSLYGGDREVTALVSSFIPMTTFDQAKDIIQYFIDNGVTDMNVVYDGWYKNGNSANFPNRFPPASGLGGARGLKDLADFVHDQGFKIFLTDWNLGVWGMNFFNNYGVVKGRDTIYDIQEMPLNWGDFFEPYYLLNPEANNRLLDKSLKYYTDWGIDGIEEFNTDDVVTDYNPSNPKTRQQFTESMNAIYKRMSDTLGSVRLWAGYTYTMVDQCTVIEGAARNSYSPLTDEHVPVYFIAYRGLVDFVTVPINTMYDVSNGLLRAAENGMNISIELTAGDTADLFYAQASQHLPSTQFENFKDYALALYQRYNTAFADVQGQFIVNHDKPANNITRTTFENGKRIICNSRHTAYNYEGISIPPLSFAVEVNGEVTIP
jgi:hypothetical protein